jgi:hypothetical protein
MGRFLLSLKKPLSLLKISEDLVIDFLIFDFLLRKQLLFKIKFLMLMLSGFPALRERHLTSNQFCSKGLFLTEDSLFDFELSFSDFSFVLKEFLAFVVELVFLATLVKVELVLLGLELVALGVD